VDLDSPGSAGVIAPDQDTKEGKRVVAAHGIEGPNFEANAALIAAAPELLEALKDAADTLDDAQAGWTAKGGTPNAVLVWRRKAVSAAIVKAEGCADGGGTGPGQEKPTPGQAPA